MVKLGRIYWIGTAAGKVADKIIRSFFKIIIVAYTSIESGPGLEIERFYDPNLKSFTTIGAWSGKRYATAAYG
jgi:hypothetical protein